MTKLDRRRALQFFAASPLVYGLSGAVAELFSQDPQPRSEPPAWLKAALEHARDTRTPLVALVLPERTQPEPVDPARAAEKAAFEKRVRLLLERRPERELRLPAGEEPAGRGNLSIAWSLQFEDPVSRFLVDLQLLLESPRYELIELLMSATWVCVHPRQVAAAAGENVVVLDERGQRIAGGSVDLADESEFERAVGHLLRDNPRHHRRAAEQMTPEVKAAIRELGSRDRTRRDAARSLLSERFARHRVALIEARRTFKNVTVVESLRDIVRSQHASATVAGLAGPLPFGVTLQERHVYDPCPPCGMARIPAASRKLLSFLAYQPK